VAEPHPKLRSRRWAAGYRRVFLRQGLNGEPTFGDATTPTDVSLHRAFSGNFHLEKPGGNPYQLSRKKPTRGNPVI